MTTVPPSENPADPPILQCRRCGRELHPGRGDLYAISILAVADPWPPVFTEDDLAVDVGAEIRRLIAQASGLDARQARDQVYRRVIFHLCISCYQGWIEDPTGS
jgi:hypothetical protein